MYVKNGKTYYSHQSLAHIDTEDKFRAYTREYHSSGEKRDRRSTRGREVRESMYSMYSKQKLPNDILEEEEDFVQTMKKGRVSRFVEKDLTELEVKTVVLDAQDVTPGCELKRMREEVLRVDGRPVVPVEPERCEIKRMSGGRPKLPRARRYVGEPRIVLGEVEMRGGEGEGRVRWTMGAVKEESEKEVAMARETAPSSGHSVQVLSTKLATAGMSTSTRSSFEVPTGAHVENVSVLFILSLKLSTDIHLHSLPRESRKILQEHPTNHHKGSLHLRGEEALPFLR